VIDVVAELDVVAAPVDMKNQSQQEVYYLDETFAVGDVEKHQDVGNPH